MVVAHYSYCCFARHGVRRRVVHRWALPRYSLSCSAGGGSGPYLACSSTSLLIISAILATRGSVRARPIWLGGLTYLVYTYVIAAFEVRFNSLFLVLRCLTGMFGLCPDRGMATVNMPEIKTGFTEKTPVKAVSIYMGVLAVLFYFLWLGEIVPALVEGRFRKCTG